jgi:hypothetical protein
MAKRIQITVTDTEYGEIQHRASLRRLSVAELIRQQLELTRRPEPSKSVAKKLEAIRAAAQHAYPVHDLPY